MRRILAVLTLAVAGVLMHPPRVAAQCNEACVAVTTPQGHKGFGCIVENDSNAACIARSTVCYSKLCYNALITGPGGTVLAAADICGDEVTLRPVARERAPAQVAARATRAKRGASVAAKARVG